MKKYRIYYMNHTYTSEVYIMASNEKEAERKFRKLKGENPKILNIEKAAE